MIKLTLTCDRCASTLPLPNQGYPQAPSGSGWGQFPQGGVPMDLCPTCLDGLRAYLAPIPPQQQGG